MFGVYFFFENGANSMKKLMADYPEFSTENFNIHWFSRTAEQNFHFLMSRDCGAARVSGNNLGLGFHVPGDTLHLQALWQTAGDGTLCGVGSGHRIHIVQTEDLSAA